MLSAPQWQAGRRAVAAAPLHRRLLAVLVAVATLLLGAPAATASVQQGQDEYRLEPARFGSERHQLIQMFRIRHPEVSVDRNVAAFFYEDENQTTWVIVAASIGRFPNNRPNTPIDIFRRAPGDTDWRVVRGDDAVDWRSHPEPSDEWTADERPELRGLHAENIARMYLAAMGTADLVPRGISEDIPCEDRRNRCRRNLENRSWLRKLTSMHYLYDNDPDGRAERTGDFREWNRNGQQLGPHPRLFDPLGEVPVQGPALGLTGPPATDPGGIDFTTVELRYLADPAPDQGIRFAFHADEDSGGDPGVAGDRLAAIRASDAFFVWLSLPRSTFWVNLHPDEPDRIVDPGLGTTDVGRILLEADLQMKRTVGELIHPDTDLGAQYWAGIDESSSCQSFRQWIVPAPATIREADGALYILDAPLSVKLESEHLESEHIAPEPDGAATPDICGRGSSGTATHEEELFRELVLPEVAHAVNHAPEYAELRQVYLARVAAEWYRQRSLDTETTFAPLIDSGNVSRWPAIQDWSPRAVFDDYVDSFTNGEFRVEREVTEGDTIYTYLYVYGGVDFANAPYEGLDDGQFQEDWRGLPDAVNQSFQDTAAGPDGGLWFGAVSHPTIPDDWAADSDTTSPARRIAILIAVGGGVVIILGMLAASFFAIRSGRPRHPRPG